MEKFPSEPTPEEIDAEIEKLLQTLDEYGDLYNKLSLELQDQWYDAEMEAKVGKDRGAAKTHLEKFLGILAKQRGKKE